MNYFDYYGQPSNKIEILNFNRSYLGIEKPIDIYWYAKYFDIYAVAFCDTSSVESLDIFLTVCEDLTLKPIYGVKFTVKTIEDTALDTIETICYAKDKKGISQLKTLCSLTSDGVLLAEHLWEHCDNLIVGLDFSKDHNIIDVAENILEYFLIPDFVFIDEKAFFSAWWDTVFERLVDMEVLICAKENSYKKLRNAYFPCFNPINSLMRDFYFLEGYTYKAVIENPRILLSKIESLL